MEAQYCVIRPPTIKGMARTRMRRASEPALAMSVVTATNRALLPSSNLWSLKRKN